MENLIENSDLVFNVTDTREARYFPTLLAKIHNKKIISCGIGRDSYVIVRHGRFGKDFRNKAIQFIKEHQNPVEWGKNPIGKGDGEEVGVGCYFCTDYVAPTDTKTNRRVD